MRRLYKYSLDASVKGTKYLAIDHTAEEHSRTMGDYSAEIGYRKKNDFFKKYFYGYQYNRLQYYDVFLRRHLKRDEEILSIASGRCANEALLLEDGFRVICSDLRHFGIHDRSRALFANFDFIELDILKQGVPRKMDAIICLSLAPYFDTGQLRRFFSNISEGLKPNGKLILELTGPSDNLASYLLNDIYLRWEILLLRAFKFLTLGKSYGVLMKHGCFCWGDAEILALANESNLILEEKTNYDFITEFRRSTLLSWLLDRHDVFKRLFAVAGKPIPHIRMFYFKKAL